MVTASNPTACETACAERAWIFVQPGWRLGGASSPVSPSRASSRARPFARSSAHSARAAPTILRLDQSDAHRMLTAQLTREKRSSLSLLLSNSAWVRGKLFAELKELFDVLIESFEAAESVLAAQEAD